MRWISHSLPGLDNEQMFGNALGRPGIHPDKE